MGLISFEDQEGNCWRVWKVETPTAQAHLMDPGYRTGWLVFEREDEVERRRLAQVPQDWESLPPHRLDALRQLAVSANTPRSGTTQQGPVTPRGDVGG